MEKLFLVLFKKGAVVAKIAFKNLRYCYKDVEDQSQFALKTTNMTWEHGKSYALLGPSGCGKSTLLNIISGLLQPTHGEVLFDDVCVLGVPTQKRNIAQVFQFPIIYDTMTVRENLGFPLRNTGVKKEVIEEKVKIIAGRLGLTHWLGKKATALSSDMKQKISLGRGLIREDINAILFDEPLTMIDPKTKWTLRASLSAVKGEYSHTMIYVTHDQTEALWFADEIVIMKAGEVLQIATPEELFENPQHTFVGYFLGSPGMNILPVCLKDAQTVILGQCTWRLNIKLPLLVNAQNLELGVRPNAVQLSLKPTDLKAKLERIEQRERFELLRLNLEGHTIFVQFDAKKQGTTMQDFIKEDWVYLVFEADKTFLFQNSCRIRGGI